MTVNCRSIKDKRAEFETALHYLKPVTGDFNCPDIRWDTQTACGPDREIQQGLADLMGASNLLDLVFASNPTLVKSSKSS